MLSYTCLMLHTQHTDMGVVSVGSKVKNILSILIIYFLNRWEIKENL